MSGRREGRWGGGDEVVQGGEAGEVVGGRVWIWMRGARMEGFGLSG